MKIPYSWLREYCDPGAGVEEIAERLVMTGTEVERIGAVGPPAADGFVVGKVISAEQHPNADRLRVCAVDTGEGERTIVCGAANVAAGQTVAVALPGARMPGGEKLRKAKLRGVGSEGMILSVSELELGGDADGIIELEDGPTPGTPLAEVLPIAEPVLELEVTPNRVDCFGIWGVAREVHAVTAAPLAPEPWAEDAPAEGEGEVADFASVTVEVPELCPRFTARVFTDVTVGPSPLWLQARLTAAGQRPINNVVDVTNYVMLLSAQPLHAFDLDKVPDGELTVRTAAEGERMTTLDGVERSARRRDGAGLRPQRADRDRRDHGRSGFGGLGGNDAGPARGRQLERHQHPPHLAPARPALGGLLALREAAAPGALHAGAADRLAAAGRALRRQAGAGDDRRRRRACPPAPRIRLRAARVEGLLGMTIPQADQVAYLERLGFGVEVDGEDLLVEVPPERHYDVTREVDLIEEVGRIHGFDEHLPTTLPAVAEKIGGLSREQQLRRRAEDVLRDLGFDQIVGWSFTDPGEPGRLRIPAGDPRAEAVLLANPLSEDQSAMRTTLLGSLLDAASRNLARDADAVALFESGAVYLNLQPVGRNVDPDRDESARRPPGGGVYGGAGGAVRRAAPAWRHWPSDRWCERSWRDGGEPADFFALKAVLEALAGQLGVALAFEAAPEPFLHPGRAAAVSIAGVPVGWIGEVHPLVCREWDLEAAVGFEIASAALIAAATVGEEIYEDVTTFPAVHQDLAVVVPVEVTAIAVRDAVLAGGGELLRSARGLRPLRRASSSARATRAWPCGSSSAPPTAPSPTRRSPVCARRSRPSWSRSEAACVSELGAQPLNGEPAARVLVAGASGFAGALAAQIVWRHPRLQLVAVTSRSDAGKRLDALYPRYRVPLELTELDLERVEGIDAAIVAYPHGAAAPTVAALRAQGILVVDLSADFRLREMDTYERWYGEHGAPDLFGQRRLRADRALPRRAARGEAGGDAGLLPDRQRARAGAAGREGTARRRRCQRDAGGLRRRSRRRRRDALRGDGRERLRLQDRGPPPPARDRTGAGGAGQPGAGRLRAAPAAARPG